MGEGSNNKRHKKGNIISQENIFPLLHRYSVTTVLTLLKEVAQVADVKIDWNELVKKTATGISSGREYQMLWRHLAYRDILEENIDEGAVPMENDSDLEFELEAHPPVSSDAASEASACVKVMIASASLMDVNLSSVVEAPLCINIPTGWLSTSSSAASEKPQQLQETNITVPVLVPKQPLSLSTVSSVEAPTIDANEPGGPSRRKRKPWSKKEDDELLAAVQRKGEGNWANILKGDFKGDRTASQLSQRWTIIKKRKENSSIGVGPQHAEFHAFRRAFHMALDMPIGDKSKSKNMNGRGGTNQNSITTSSNSTRPIAGEPSQHQHHRQDPDHMMTSSKSRYMKTSTSSPALSPDDLVKAAAVAAGARIATASDAATLLKAAHSKNAVHIIPTGGNSAKSSSGPSNINSLPPNVHYIRTGLVNRSTSGHNNNSIMMNNNALRPGGTHHPHSQLTRLPLPTPLTNPPQTANESNSPKEKVSEKVIYVSCNEAKEGNIQDQALRTEADEQAKKESALPGSETHLESENIHVENPLCLSLSKLEKAAALTDTGTENRNEKEEKNKMIEMPVEEIRENKAIADAKGSEKGEESRIVELLPVQEETKNISIAEKSASELEEESKSIEISVEEERENN